MVCVPLIFASLPPNKRGSIYQVVCCMQPNKRGRGCMTELTIEQNAPTSSNWQGRQAGVETSKCKGIFGTNAIQASRNLVCNKTSRRMCYNWWKNFLFLEVFEAELLQDIVRKCQPDRWS